MEIKDITQKCIDTVRVLSADAVQKANSGHPGTPMALSPLGHVLWSEIMHYNPKNPKWANRDRFILSCGHACMLEYSFLHLTGYNITLKDLQNFRQLHSITAGHPEYRLTPGIEVTTGPLGQGFANGVGMAIAQKYLAARYNLPDFKIFDYKIYAICSDGDMMEGISSEAASLAGHLGLGNMIYFYDDNHITIEGNTDLTFNEDVSKRFDAYGWHVQNLADVNDLDALRDAIAKAQNETNRPSLIKVQSIIGYGSPNKHNTAAAHGSALGEEEVRLVKENLGFDPNKNFVIPDEVKNFYRKAGEHSAENEKTWKELYKNYKKQHPEFAKEYETISTGELPEAWEENLPTFQSGEKMATRKASGKTLNALAKYFPQLIGGSADLAPSTDTNLHNYKSFSNKHLEDRNFHFDVREHFRLRDIANNNIGRNFHFGIREHAMGAILNGMALSDYLIPYGATFLIFSDYMRPPLRLAAIMKIRTIMVFTHDSIGLGEDGTTHQPVEQLIGLRTVPNMTVIRPADANETAQAWRAAILTTNGPVAIILTRQGIPIIDQKKYALAKGLLRGGYILSDTESVLDIILIASGSEVHLLLEAQKILKKDGIQARVVSMPSWSLFDKQSTAYHEEVLPKKNRNRLAVEAGSPMGWLKYVTEDGDIIGIEKFGESAPGEELMKEYGFSVENVVKRAKALIRKNIKK